MTSKNDQTIYIRKSAQATLRTLSELTRLSQSQILAEWLGEIQKVLDVLPESYRLTLASYANVKSKPKQVQTLFAPILCESLTIPDTFTEEEESIVIQGDVESKLRNVKKPKRKKKVLRK